MRVIRQLGSWNGIRQWGSSIPEIVSGIVSAWNFHVFNKQHGNQNQETSLWLLPVVCRLQGVCKASVWCLCSTSCRSFAHSLLHRCRLFISESCNVSCSPASTATYWLSSTEWTLCTFHYDDHYVRSLKIIHNADIVSLCCVRSIIDVSSSFCQNCYNFNLF